ncbi:MAG: amino acid permease [Gammaproteobacteria bacterium]|nr:amino acid permease [Gammaproteobacteria bacterium]
MLAEHGGGAKRGPQHACNHRGSWIWWQDMAKPRDASVPLPGRARFKGEPDREAPLKSREAAPRPALRAIDGMAMVIGLVVGAGIFRAPAEVAANLGSASAILLSWLLGGVVSVLGALCYAELAAAFPHAGGEYHFLQRAYGKTVSFVFAWSRMLILQTGSIALLAFVMADYVAAIVPLDARATAAVAGGGVVLLTALNLAGLRSSTAMQNVLTLVTVGGLVAIIVAGLLAPAAPAAAPLPPPQGGTFGLAMVFVLLTYGGWNEAAYVSAELRNVQRNMGRVLLASLALVTVMYLLINLAYLKVLGVTPMAQSDAVTAELVRRSLGQDGARLSSLLIVIAVLSSINVTIFTGARTNYALARDFPTFAFLGHWSARTHAPTRALLVQGTVALLLVIAGAASRSGFEAMVSYVSPVFWSFFLLTTLALVVLRRRDPTRVRPFRVPGYPATPLLFAAACGYMLYASLAYSGWGALFGVLIAASGLPVALWRTRRAA